MPAMMTAAIFIEPRRIALEKPLSRLGLGQAPVFRARRMIAHAV